MGTGKYKRKIGELEKEREKLEKEFIFTLGEKEELKKVLDEFEANIIEIVKNYTYIYR